MPLVSIALCVYNGEKYLAQQLDSLISQSYKNIEIVALDDCSSDGSFHILNQYKAKFPDTFRVYSNRENKGYVKNFEAALNLCEGEYIAFCDQDDIWFPDKIERQVAGIQDSLLIYHDSQFMQEDGTYMDKKMSEIINMIQGSDPVPFLLFNSISGHSLMIHRRLLPHILPFDPQHFHDHWTAYVAANLGSITYLPECLVAYRQHQTSSTDILNRRKKLDKKYHENRDLNKLKKELTWLKKCQHFSGNRDPQFINSFVSLFEARLNDFFSFAYAQFIKTYFDRLFYVQKKRKSSRSGYIYRQIWGLKAKRLWATLFSW